MSTLVPEDPRAPGEYVRKARAAYDAAQPRLSGRTQALLALAEEAARADDDDHVGTEHIVLGIFEEGGRAADLLRGVGVTRELFAAQLYEEPGRSPEGAIPLTPRSRMILGLAMDCADEVGQQTILPEHVLMGVIRESGLWRTIGKSGPFHLAKATHAAGIGWDEFTASVTAAVREPHG